MGVRGFAAAGALALRAITRSRAVKALPPVSRSFACRALAGSTADVALHPLLFFHAG